MKSLVVSLLCLASVFGLNEKVRAEVSAQTVNDFLLAQAAVYRDGSPASIEKLLAFMTDDVKDIHVAYGREFAGKAHFREHMPAKAKALISYERQVSQIMLGTDVAVAVINERSSERKRDNSIKDYQGRTIIVLDFNDDGLITQMRRYQD